MLKSDFFETRLKTTPFIFIPAFLEYFVARRVWLMQPSLDGETNIAGMSR